ncbi:MAG: DUF4105 domain-containing protein [Myxococcales bacterium]|nr:DUF4105 domain-containing protein [Myxococcales bacterium]
MPRRIVLYACLILALAGRVARADEPLQPTPEHQRLANEYPRVVLVTMGVGALIWERHGHIALCIEYEDRSQNACYNYGIGDFLHPVKMFWGFFRGDGSFWVGEMNPGTMLAIYRNADRTIWVQPLPLTQPQKAKVIEKLKFDIREENKYYSYDHFWDNCTTRVRDILDDATDHALSNMVGQVDDRTFRDLALEGFYGMKIPRLITDLAMGRVTDRVPTYYERMFLPDYLREAVVTLWHIQPKAIYERKGPPAVLETEMRLADPTRQMSAQERAALEQNLADLNNAGSGRVMFLFVVLLLTAPAWATRLVGRFQRAGLAFAVIPPALLGTVFLFLAIISPLPYVRWNETCLALMPFDFLLLALNEDRRKKYARGRTVMLGLLLLLNLINVIRAPIWPAIIWALVPNATVGFLPRKAAPAAAADGKQAKKAA